MAVSRIRKWVRGAGKGGAYISVPKFSCLTVPVWSPSADPFALCLSEIGMCSSPRAGLRSHAISGACSQSGERFAMSLWLNLRSLVAEGKL